MKTKSYTVLVIEDEKLLLNAIAIKLKLSGLSAMLATSGSQALEVLSQAQKLPDAIWLDYYLNDMNGLDFMNALKKNDKLAHIPTIVVSNSASDDKVKNMLALGVNKYYLKAENRLDDIIGYVKEFVERRGYGKV